MTDRLVSTATAAACWMARWISWETALFAAFAAVVAPLLVRQAMASLEERWRDVRVPERSEQDWEWIRERRG